VSYYEILPPPDDDLTERADDEERHWRAIAELTLPGDALGEPEGPEHDHD
jgi:hypothetical protein